jgi:hypothetical protein
MSLTDLSRVGWTAAASSYYDAATSPDKALDGTDVQNSSFWISDANAPQSITIDMGSTQPFNYIKYQPGNTRFYDPVFWGQGNPAFVKVYISTNGSTWTLVGTEVWPNEKRVEYVHFPPQSARYFKIEIISFDRRDYFRAVLAEVYAGWWDGQGQIKLYRKAHPRFVEDLSPYTDPDHDQGETSNVTASNSQAGGKIKIWHTSGLATYPELLFTNWNLPHNWRNIPWETISMVIEGSHTEPSWPGKVADFTLLNQRGSAQDIFDFEYAWYADSNADFTPIHMGLLYDMSQGAWEGLVTLGDSTQKDLNSIWSSIYLWASAGWNAASHNDEDCGVLNITDHYILFTYWGTPYSVYTDGARNAQHISY